MPLRRLFSPRLFTVLVAFAALVLLLGSVLHPRRALGTTTTTLIASADSSISRARPDTNYGNALWVATDGSPLRYGYYRFDVTVPDGEQVTNALFKCWAGSSSSSGASISTAANDWTEGGITWNNAPMPDLAKAPVAGTGPVNARSFATADVTSAITGSGVYTLVMTTASRVAWSCGSTRRGTAQAPQLLITLSASSGPTPTPTPIAPSSTPTPSPPSSSPTPVPPSSSLTPVPPSSSPTPIPPSNSPSPRANDGHKLLVIMEENHSLSEFMNGAEFAYLARTYGQDTNYNAITHPSLPNYYAVWGGTTMDVSDCPPGPTCPAPPSNVWDETIAAGGTAKSYAESMPTTCAIDAAGPYVPRHAPWPYWQNPTSRANCDRYDVPLGSAGSGAFVSDIHAAALPRTGFVTPNLDDDAHNGTVAQASAWLATYMPILLDGPDFKAGNLTIIITADEDDASQSNTVPFIVVDPRLRGVTITTALNHYSLCRWLADNAGVTPPGNAATADDAGKAFGL